MGILCRLGLHSWKPVKKLAPMPFFIIDYSPGIRTFTWPEGWLQVANKCRRCGKRVSL